MIGCWSSDWGYDSAMEDEWFVLRGDGTGWSAYLRPWYTHATLFRWVVHRPGTLSVVAYREVELDESGDDDVLDVTPLELSVEAGYRIEEGTRPTLDSPVPLLTVDLPFLQLPGEYAFESGDEPVRDFLRKAGVQT